MIAKVIVDVIVIMKLEGATVHQENVSTAQGVDDSYSCDHLAIGTSLTSVTPHFVIVLPAVSRGTSRLFSISFTFEYFNFSFFFRVFVLCFSYYEGKRDLLSLCLLRDFPVTISLENHGELTAHSRCSNNLPVAVCGKIIAHEEKSHLQQTLLSALTALQGRENLAKEQEELRSSNIQSSKEIQPENTMFYTSKTKKEELERYQDCSWFQGKPSKEDLISKLSQAEDLISPNIEVNELDLGMQFANRDVPLWGDEYLEVFDDEDFHYELNEKFGEKENHIYPSNENTAYINHKLGEDGLSDLSIFNNYPIKKTDSYDNMKMITSTNLSDVIPMSYQEQVNNVNYNLQPFDKIKCEVKEELGIYSPDSDSYIMESEDSDLNVGREEVVEVEVNEYEGKDQMVSTCTFEVSKPAKEVMADIEAVKVDQEELQYRTYLGNDLVGVEEKTPVQELKNEISCEGLNNSGVKKAEMKLELAKNTFEQCLNVPTPELDFMDLINYINNEMGPGCDTQSQFHVEQPPAQNLSMPLKESSPNTVTVLPLQLPPQEEENANRKESFPKSGTITTEKVQLKRASFNDLGTINSEDVSDTMSIAERIKTGTSRKRPSRYSLENIQPSEDEENQEDSDEYEFELDLPRKRRCRSKSRNSESVSSKCSGDNYIDSYREKRDKNNEASRRSRQNKKDKDRQMHRSREEAERRNVVLKAKADKLEKLVTYLRQMLLQLVLKKGSGT